MRLEIGALQPIMIPIPPWASGHGRRGSEKGPQPFLGSAIRRFFRRGTGPSAPRSTSMVSIFITGSNRRLIVGLTCGSLPCKPSRIPSFNTRLSPSNTSQRGYQPHSVTLARPADRMSAFAPLRRWRQSSRLSSENSGGRNCVNCPLNSQRIGAAEIVSNVRSLFGTPTRVLVTSQVSAGIP